MGLAELGKKSVETDTHPIKVLVADDDAPTRILLRAAVSQWGYQVVEASDGEEAWNILQLPDTPRLIIVDWLMPKLDGIDLCRRIKNESNFSPYIILLTQLTGTTNIVKGLEAGANEFLSKPFNMAELQSRLSVGARIIKYQDNLEKKEAELKEYCAQVEELSKMMADMMKKMEEVVKGLDQAHEGKLTDLQDDFKKTMALLSKLDVGIHHDGSE